MQDKYPYENKYIILYYIRFFDQIFSSLVRNCNSKMPHTDVRTDIAVHRNSFVVFVYFVLYPCQCIDFIKLYTRLIILFLGKSIIKDRINFRLGLERGTDQISDLAGQSTEYWAFLCLVSGLAEYPASGQVGYSVSVLVRYPSGYLTPQTMGC